MSKKLTSIKKKIQSLRKQIYAVLIFMFLFTACIEFDFVNQPYTADPNSFFDVQISVSFEEGAGGYGVFGIMLPIGWTTTDTIEYIINSTNDTGLVIYSEIMALQMASIDPPPENYYWWVGDSYHDYGYGVIIDFKIFTDNQTGSFFLDYMIGDTDYGGDIDNYERSNDHLIIIGEPVGCLPEGITFLSQEEIDSFQANYPNCTEMAGDIIISGANITNLSGLDVITSIGGSLRIDSNNILTSLMGLENLTSIEGTLSITYNDSLYTLFGLENLTHINRSLIIGCRDDAGNSSNPSLINLSGLNNVTTIGGNLSISGNDALTSLAGLNNVISIGQDFNIIENYALPSIDGLNNVISIGEDFNIYDNYPMTNLSGLNNLTFIAEDLNIYTNYGFTSITGLNNVISIGEDFNVIQNNDLTGITGLNNLTSIGGTLRLYDNSNLNNILGLDNLISIGENLTVHGGNLTSLAGFDNVASIGGNLDIQHNGALTSLEGLNSLAYIEGSLIIGNGGSPYNTSLVSLTGLDNLITIGGDLRIGINEVLTSLTGLNNVISIGGDLSIWLNNSLSSLDGLENIDAGSIDKIGINNNTSLSDCAVKSICDFLVSPNGNITFDNNSSGCTGLGQVQDACEALHCLPEGITFTSQEEIDNFQTNYPTCLEIDGHVEISGADINNLDSLYVLTAIGGNLSILQNNSLINMTGLNNVISIGGDIWVENNDLLVSLTGLENIDAGSISDLEITYNSSLSTCHVQSICDYLTSPNGTIEIHDNAPSCNSPEEVMNACFNSINEKLDLDRISISPNPVNDYAILSLNTSTSGEINICIFNTTGICLKSWHFQNKQIGQQEFYLELNGLPGGIYFCRIQVGHEMVTKKIIKL